jgi:hypothetical protein
MKNIRENPIIPNKVSHYLELLTGLSFFFTGFFAIRPPEIPHSSSV